MARTTIADLRDRIAELEEENESLTETLDEVYNIVAPEESDESDESDDSN